MALTGSRVGIVGGSIAGCAAAIALRRAGVKRVSVFEQADRHAFADRGVGIAIPSMLSDALKAHGYLPVNHPSIHLGNRQWVIADGSPAGRLLWDQPSAGGEFQNWAVLWSNLRSQLPDDVYHSGKRYKDHTRDDNGCITVSFEDGSCHECDVLVGADGYHSAIRQSMAWGTDAEYAGYILWRGSYPESRIPSAFREAAERAYDGGVWNTVVFDGGHAISYMMPNFKGQTDVGNRLFNWGLYTMQPNDPTMDFSRYVAPGGVTRDAYTVLDKCMADHLPPETERLFRLTPRDEVMIQPAYDELAVAFADVESRVLLVGDAAAVARTHTAAGATKALQDAMHLEGLVRDGSTWDDVLQTFNDERLENANNLVLLGRRLGAAQVEDTPNWADMTPTDFEQWSASLLAGQKLYIYTKEQ